MTKAAALRLTWFILGLGLVVIAVAYVLFGRVPAQSATVGVAVALANWYSLRFIVARVLVGSMRRKAAFSLVLSVKMAALMALCVLLIRTGLVQPIAFTAGISALPLGALLGSFAHVLWSPPATPSES
jgi:hypothetical protein